MTQGVSIPQTDRRSGERPIFSAYELGKIAITRYDIGRITEGKIQMITDRMSVMEVHSLYEEFEELDFLPVGTREGKICGYLKRQTFLASLSQGRFSRELLLRPDVRVESIMDTRVVTLDSYTTLSEASNQLMRREESIRFDHFVITHEGRYYGISNVRRVLDGLNFYVRLDMDACNTAQATLIDETNLGEHHEGPIQTAHLVDPLLGPGGDYTATFDLGKGLSIVTLFDVCGKGLRASNMVMAIGSALRTWVEFDAVNDVNEDRFNVVDAMARLNNIIFRMTPDDMYATGAVLFIDSRRKILQVFDYGHGFVWLKRKNRIFTLGQSADDPALIGKMPFFGVNEDYRLKPVSYRLKDNDYLFCCSDGIIEAFNPEKEEYGDERLIEVIAGSSPETPEELIQEVLESWKEFRKGARRTDDLSMVSVRFSE